MSTITASHPKIERISFSRLLWVGPLAGVVAAVANLIVYVIVQNLFGMTLMGPSGPGSTEMAPLPAAAIIIASLIPALVATILLALLGLFLARPILVFWIVSVVFLLISFMGPLDLPVNTATKVILNLMHVVAAIPIVGILTTLGRKH